LTVAGCGDAGPAPSDGGSGSAASGHGGGEAASVITGLPDGAPGTDAGDPLQVMLVPADGGTEEGTKADFEPIFNAVSQASGLHFQLRVGNSYNAVVEGMVNGKVDIAFFGPVTFYQASQRGAAELLAVAVQDGESVYYSGIFAREAANFDGPGDLAGRNLAFGDVNSTSSFAFPVAMLLAAEVDPVHDLGRIFITGSHANSLAALSEGKVDAAGASYTSFEKAVENGSVDPTAVEPIAKSDPIPYPPLAMHTDLPGAVKAALTEAFHTVHKSSAINPEQIRGYGGEQVARYNAHYPPEKFDQAMRKISQVTDELKGQMLRKAAE
jgi:phosphonate transport system substrate-binding protein